LIVFRFLGLERSIGKCGHATFLNFPVEAHIGLSFFEVAADGFLGVGIKVEAAFFEEDAAGTKGEDGAHVVADEDDGAATFVGNVVHFVEAFFLELVVPYGEDFIDQEYVGFQVGGNGEGQSHIHAAGVAFDGGFQEFFHASEVYDFVEFGLDFGAVHAEDGSVEKDVFLAGEFGVKAGADFEEAADFAVEGDAAFGGRSDAAEEFEEGGFASSVSSNEADDFAFFYLKGDVVEAPEVFVFGAFPFFSREEFSKAAANIVPQCGVAVGRILPVTRFDAVAFGEVLNSDHD